MRKLFHIFIALCMSVGLFSAQADAGLQEQIEQFYAGSRVWNPSVMESARSGFAEIAREKPGEYAPLYWQSVSEFFLMLCYGLPDSTGYDPDRISGILDAAEKTMKAAIDARPKDAECRAMLSSAYGFRIMLHPLSAVWNGPKVLSLQNDALENEPDNPRVLYIIAAGYFRAPRLFRDVEKARDMLEKAEGLFREIPADAPQWGRAECSGVLGDLLREAGEPTAARERYQQALRFNPNYTPAQVALKEMNDEPE
jgi:tetratricopeptide (TPR) repeat protein